MTSEIMSDRQGQADQFADMLEETAAELLSMANTVRRDAGLVGEPVG